MITRRSTLKAIGLAGGIVLGTGTASARGHRAVEPTFFARLSDNPSVPGHKKVYSRGKGRLDLIGGEETPLTFEIAVRNLDADAVEIDIRGGGSTAGTVLARLYGPEGSDASVEGASFNDDSIAGTLTDGDVDLGGGVSSLIWDELVEGNGVVTVKTDGPQGVEIAGVVRPRPVAGWIAV